jgi:hypothetical protein
VARNRHSVGIDRGNFAARMLRTARPLPSSKAPGRDLVGQAIEAIDEFANDAKDAIVKPAKHARYNGERNRAVGASDRGPRTIG